MLSPNSNWYFRLKGLTFLYISVLALLIMTSSIDQQILQDVYGYSVFVIFGIWGLTYLFTCKEMHNMSSKIIEKTPKMVTKVKKLKK